MSNFSKIKPSTYLLTLLLLANGNFALSKTIKYENVPIQRAQVELTEEQLLDVGIGWITVRLNSEENFDISIDGQIVPQEGN